MPVGWSPDERKQAEALARSLPDEDPRKAQLASGIDQWEAERAKPGAAEIAGMGRLPENDSEQARVNKVVEAQKAEDAQKAFVLADTDKSLQSHSQRKSLYAPPEIHPDPRKSLRSPIQDLVSFLPDTIPGLGMYGLGTKMHAEPTLAEFRAMDPAFKGLGKDSSEYKEFADKMWQQEAKSAELNGRSAVRTDFMPTPGLISKTVKGAAQLKNSAMDMAESAGLGLGGMLSGGLATKVLPALGERAGVLPKGTTDVLSDVQEESPVASAAGALYGGLEGAPGLMAAIAGKAGAGAVGKLAAAAGGSRLADNASQGIADKLRDRPAPTLSVGGLVAEPLTSAAIGGAIGGLGKLAGNTQVNLREGKLNPGRAEAVRALDRASADKGEYRGLSPLSMFGDTARLTPAMEENFVAEAAPGSKTNAPMQATSRIAPKLAEGLQAEHQKLSDAWDNTVQGYMAGPGASAKVAPTNLIRGLTDVVKGHQYEGTTDPLPFTRIVGAAKGALNRATEISKPSVSVPKDGIPGEVMTVGNARIAGYDIPGNPDPSLKVKVTAKPMGADEFESMMSELSLAANEGKDIGPETYRKWAADARTDRDKFPGDWSAKHTEFHGALSEIEGKLRNLGIQPKRTLIPDEVSRGTNAAVSSYKGEGSVPDKTLEGLAKTPEDVQRLREVAAHAAVPTVNQAGKFVRPGLGIAGGLSGLRVSLDPLAGLISRTAPKVAAAAGAQAPRYKVPGSKSPLTLDEVIMQLSK